MKFLNIKSCDALTESTKEYQHKVKEKNNQLSPIDKFIDFVSNIVKSIKQKISGKVGLAANQSSLFHNARFKSYAINNYTKENFSHFMQNGETTKNLTALYKNLSEKNITQIDFSDFTAITALEIDETTKFLLLEVARIINFIRAFVAKIRHSSDKVTNTNSIFLEYLNESFGKEALKNFDLKIFDEILKLYSSLSKNNENNLHNDIALFKQTVSYGCEFGFIQSLAEMQEFMMSHVETSTFEISQNFLKKNEVVLTNPDADFQNLIDHLQKKTEENANLLKQALGIIHLAHTLQDKAKKASYESFAEYILDNLGQKSIKIIKNFDLDILDSIAKFIPANQANNSFREAINMLKEALNMIKQNKPIEQQIKTFVMN